MSNIVGTEPETCHGSSTLVGMLYIVCCYKGFVDITVYMDTGILFISSCCFNVVVYIIFNFCEYSTRLCVNIELVISSKICFCNHVKIFL